MISSGGWRKKPFWIRLLHWEYWNFQVIYVPIYPIFIFLCLRARSFFFFSAANPKIRNGGFLAESKKDIYYMVPPEFQPRTLFFTAGRSPALVAEQLLEAQFHFPLIGKPDMGGKGRGVKKLEDLTSVKKYAQDSRTDFHIQEFVSFEKEMGIFYYRYPGMSRGNISGIVEKEFLKVVGDGKQNIGQLLQNNPRAILQVGQIQWNEPGLLDRVIAANEIFTVVPYGNHARGALFLDQSATVSPELEDWMDEICKKIPDFYFGRLDIRYESRELLEAGKSFFILEVNGAGSEPTHIYDPRHSIFFAWKEIVRHWIILYKISIANHRLGHDYLSFSQGVNMFRTDSYNSKKLSVLQKIPSE
jgi:hypothetical protein